MEDNFLNVPLDKIDSDLIGKWQLLGIADNLYSNILANDKLAEISELSIKENEFCDNCNVFGYGGKTTLQLGNTQNMLDCEYIVAEDINVDYLKRDRLFVFIINAYINNAIIKNDLPNNFDDYSNIKKTRKQDLPIWLLECEKNVGKILVFEKKSKID